MPRTFQARRSRWSSRSRWWGGGEGLGLKGHLTVSGGGFKFRAYEGAL